MIAMKHLVVATDFSDLAGVAATYGRELARRLGGSLHLVHVVADISAVGLANPGYMAGVGDLLSRAEEDARARLDELLTAEDRAELGARAVVITGAAPAQAIAEFARDLPADLLVMGTHGRGAFAQLMLGSVAERVLRLAPCPVLIVKHPEREFVQPDVVEVTARV